MLALTLVLGQEEDDFAWLEMAEGEQNARPYIEEENR
jgi:hypothetical protein